YAMRLQHHARPAAERLRPFVEERAEAAVLELRDDGERLALALRGAQLLAEHLERVVPGHGLQRVTLAALGAGEPVGMVEALHRGLPARAQRALAHRMLGAALELHHAALAIAREHAAARRALAADCGEPRGRSGER